MKELIFILLILLQSGMAYAGLKKDPENQKLNLSDTVTITLQEINNSGTYYDIQSNGVVRYIVQDPANPARLHAVFMVDPSGVSGFPDRRTRYYFSPDTGNSWNYVTNVPSARSGFPAITILPDGREVVGLHTTDCGEVLGARIYIDQYSGSGLFSCVGPPPIGINNPVWIALTSTFDEPNRIIFVASTDTAYRNAWLGGNNFSGYVPVPNSETANSYSLARGPNHKICIAYITGFLNPSIPHGAVEYIESTDNGTTWSAPVRVFTPNYNLNGIGAFRSVDVQYLRSSIRIFFGLAVFDASTGGFYPDSTAIEKLWGPDLNGGVPVTVDSIPGMSGSNFINGSDMFVGVCRGVLGTSVNNSLLYTAWCRARSDTDSQGNNYFDIYFSYSANGGLNWLPRVRVTNNSGPLRDCRFPSISPQNHFTADGKYFVHAVYQSDSVPGSYVNGAHKSLAHLVYARITLNNSLSGISNNNEKIPNKFVLFQNYPNPFNPSTKIRFDIPVSAFTKLTVFDVLGREVEVLVNGQIKRGSYEIEWDGSRFSSGVYFYKIESGDFVNTKKMVLIR